MNDGLKNTECKAADRTAPLTEAPGGECRQRILSIQKYY